MFTDEDAGPLTQRVRPMRLWPPGSPYGMFPHTTCSPATQRTLPFPHTWYRVSAFLPALPIPFVLLSPCHSTRSSSSDTTSFQRPSSIPVRSIKCPRGPPAPLLLRTHFHPNPVLTSCAAPVSFRHSVLKTATTPWLQGEIIYFQY